MSRFEQHGGTVQVDPGRSGRKAKVPRGWRRPDEPRPGPRHLRREAMRLRAETVASVEVHS